MIRAFVFDMDGLLVETESIQIRAFEKFMDEKGIKYPEGYADTFVGFSIRKNVDRIKRELGLKGDTEALAEERNGIYLKMLAGEPIVPLPGVRSLFDFAEKQKLKVAVCSSSDRNQLDLVLPRLLSALGKEPDPERYFDAIVCGSDVLHLKPEPDLYLECADRLSLPPSECLALEDSAAGAASATAADMKLVVVPNEYSHGVQNWPTVNVLVTLSEVLDSGLVSARDGGVHIDDEAHDTAIL